MASSWSLIQYFQSTEFCLVLLCCLKFTAVFAMAVPRALLICLALFLLASENKAAAKTALTAEATFANLYGITEGSLHPQECSPRCNVRCSATAYKKPCLFFCQKCCATCLCVPPGTYGNKQLCPCYANWKTKRGGPKCP